MIEGANGNGDGQPPRWFLYLLECRDGSYYAGIATDVQARFNAHLAGKGARYTRAHPPLRILGFCEYANRSAAAKAEWRLKRTPREGKQAWLEAAINAVNSRVAAKDPRPQPPGVPGIGPDAE